MISNMTSDTTKPFLKWVGGKRKIASALIDNVPNDYEYYNEPFVGGGALFFALNPDKAYLSDINPQLIITYQMVADDVDKVIDELEQHEKKHDKDYYYEARRRFQTEENPIAVAGLFIYLNRTCFNGIYRTNLKGEFNSPFGYHQPPILDVDNLRSASKMLQKANINFLRFDALDPVGGDFYYLDPPYHQTFSLYSSSRFDDDDHENLAEYAKIIDGRGGYFLLSNSDTPFIRRLYKDYNISVISNIHSVGYKAGKKGRTDELLIKNYD